MDNSMQKVQLFLLLTLLVCGAAYSHPHVFIDTKVQIRFSVVGLSGFIVEWVFDDMFSSTIIADYDGNRNGTFESDETAAVQDGAFSNLRHYNYFILLVASNNEELEIENVRDFKAEITQGKVQYAFYVPLEIEAEVQEKEIKIGVFDNTYFCDVAYANDSPVTINGHEAIDSRYRLVKEAEKAYWGGQIVPQVIVLRFKKK